MSSESEGPVTQIIYLDVPETIDLELQAKKSSSAWAIALEACRRVPGFQRQYWGRSPESPARIQLHVVRDNLKQHSDFLKGTSYRQFCSALEKLNGSTAPLLIRHAYMKELTPNCQALGKGAPFTGTAIYLSTDAAWHEGAWPLWTHVVRHVPGNLGCAGGRLVEQVDGHDNAYMVLVGWESIEAHEDYHHTKHWAKHRVILTLGHKGYREYGHVVLKETEDTNASKL